MTEQGPSVGLGHPRAAAWQFPFSHLSAKRPSVVPQGGEGAEFQVTAVAKALRACRQVRAVLCRVN